ncbi:CBS domain pair protein [Aciduliprofundum boonei T469]|nr:CBS domain pair protein [Aciduliprofundum boonei T469]
MMPSLSSIKERRKRLGWTQKELAERSGVSQSAITKIEKGDMNPSYTLAVKIFNALDEGEREKYKGKKAKDLMNKDVIFLSPKDRVKKARELMKEHGISQIPVVDKGKVVGMITEDDILEGYEKHGAGIVDLLVEDVMSSPPIAVRGDTRMDAIVELLRQEQALLVVENDKLVGIITKADIVYKG